MSDPIMVQAERDSDEIAAEAYREMELEEKGEQPEKKPVEEPVEPSTVEPKEEPTEPSEEKPEEEQAQENQRILEADESTLTEEEKVRKEELVNAIEEDNKRILEADESTLSDEEKAKKEELVKVAEESKPSEEDVIRDHALKHNLTIDEAKEDIAKTKAVVEKYKGDPIELARALRSTQSGYDQLKAKEGKPQVIIQKDPLAEIREFAEKNQEKIIENYRKKFPAKSEGMTDEIIIEESIAQAERDYEVWAKNENENIKRLASGKREELLALISEEDKKFLPDVKALLYRTPDNQVVHESFDIKDLINYSRGAYYTPERIKAIEADAFKRGKESPKILGVKTPTSGGPAPKVPKGVSSVTLNEDQKDRALEMFPAEDGYSQEQSFKAFIDTYKEELKKNKNFI